MLSLRPHCSVAHSKHTPDACSTLRPWIVLIMRPERRRSSRSHFHSTQRFWSLVHTRGTFILDTRLHAFFVAAWWTCYGTFNCDSADGKLITPMPHLKLVCFGTQVMQNNTHILQFLIEQVLFILKIWREAVKNHSWIATIAYWWYEIMHIIQL